MANVAETWRGIPGYRGYEVSDMGRVRSLDRTVAAKYTLKGRRSSRLIKGQDIGLVVRPNGLPCVNLWRAGRYIQVPLRRLVLATFVGPRPQRMEADNVNGNLSDCRLSNLRWAPKKTQLIGVR